MATLIASRTTFALLLNRLRLILGSELRTLRSGGCAEVGFTPRHV